MSLPAGDVRQWDVLEWVLDQARFLTPSQHHLLMYLCTTAFYKTDNPESGEVGQVLSARTTQAEIARCTGLSDRQVRRVLDELCQEAYISYEPVRGPQKPSRIVVMWDETFDILRDHIRAGLVEVPELLLRKYPTDLDGPPKEETEEPNESKVVTLDDYRQRPSV